MLKYIYLLADTAEDCPAAELCPYLFSCCLSCFSCCPNKVLGQKHFKGERVCFASSSLGF